MPASSRLGAAVPVLAALAVVAIAACSSPAGTPNGANPSSGTAPTTAGQASGPVLAGEACSYFTADEVGAVVGTKPVEVKERAGRGDCDYFLRADQSAKVNVGFFEWAADGQSVFETTKAFGDAASIDLGDEAFSIYNESIGTVVAVHAGDSVIVVQAFNTGDQAAQLEHAKKLAEAFYNKI